MKNKMLLFDMVNVMLQVIVYLKLYVVKLYILLAIILNIIPYKGCDKTFYEL